MNKIYNTNQSEFIVYNKYKSKKKTNICVIFLHGLYSDMHGSKAQYLLNYCKLHEYNFIVFDNFGHGSSSGKFSEQNIGSWLKGLTMILDQLAVNMQVILIGSSMGGWISLLGGIKYTQQISGIIGIAPAADFTQYLWDSFSDTQKNLLHQRKEIELLINRCKHPYLITNNLIEEAKNHLLLNKEEINIICPVHLIHGMKDLDVSYDISIKLLQKIKSQNVTLKLIKDGEHRLSREYDLKIISNSLDEIVNQLSHQQLI